MPKPFDPRIMEIAEKLPPKLYKYCDPTGERRQWTRNLIVDSDLFFARPSSFNDPLDCRIPPTFHGSAEDIQAFWTQRRPNEPVGVSRMVRLSQTTAGQHLLTARYFKTLDTYGLACFAEHPDTFLMWSYYAAGHTGIAVRFDLGIGTLRQLRPGYLPLQVQYADDFPDVSFYDPDRFGLALKTLSIKANAWKHEKEWRVIRLGRSGLARMPSEMIDGVIFGLRTPVEVKESIRVWVAEAGRPIDLLKVVHRPNSFLLDVVSADS